MADDGLTLGHFRELTKDLPDDTHISECDYDESHLHCYPEQILIESERIIFVSNNCYERWMISNFDNTDKPIPDDWKE